MSNEIIRTETYPTGRVEIILDQFPENPRTSWDHAGTMTSCNRSYLRNHYADENRAPSNLREMALGIGGLALPVTHYDGTGRYVVGRRRSVLDMEEPDAWVYVDSATARKEGFLHPGGSRHAGKIDWSRVEQCLRSEMETFSAYSSGECYGWRAIAVCPLTGEETEVSAVWGYFGDGEIPGMLEEGRAALPTNDANREFDLAEAMAA